MYLSDVLSGTAEIANLCGKRNTPQYISGLAGIGIECAVNTVLHHIHIHSRVVGTCCFPADIRVGVGGNCSSGCELASKWMLLSCVHQTCVPVACHGLISW